MRPLRRATGARAVAATAMTVIAIAALVEPSPAQESPASLTYEQDIHLTYEFDDNVREELVDPVHAQVAKMSYLGDLRWAGGDQRLAFSYAGGFKRHLDIGHLADDGDPDVPNQFVHQGSLEYLRRLTRDLFVNARVGAKTRQWTGSDFFFINEDTFTLYTAELGTVLNLQPLEPDHPVRLEIGGRYSDIEFENVDQFFGNWTVGGDVSLAKRFDSSLETRASYSFDRVRYPGRGALERGDQPQDITGVDRPRQEDRVHELAAEIEWFGPVGILAEYRFRFNDSNSFGFENFSHNVGIQVLRQLPWGMLVQAYGQVELRTYTEPVPVLPAGSLDVGEPEDNVLLLRLVKDISEGYSVEARYARYRNESIILNDFYSKNIYSIGVTIRP